VSVAAAPVSSLASVDMRSALEVQAGLIQEAVRPLHEAVDSLHDWMLAIGGFLERAEAVLDRLSRLPADPLVLPVVGKVGATGASLHGCFSPRARASSVITAPVMKIMPEILELCGGVLTPPSVEEVRPGSHVSSDVASPTCLGFEKCYVVDAAVSLSLDSDRQMVPNFLLMMGYLSLDCRLPCLELSSPGKFAIFSPPWLLPTLDLRLADGCPQCRSMSLTVQCWSVLCECVLVLRC
jgi:hypothetical protein